VSDHANITATIEQTPTTAAADFSFVGNVMIPLLALVVGAFVQWFVQRYRFNLEGIREHHRDLKQYVIAKLLEGIRKAEAGSLVLGIADSCDSVLLGDLLHHYPELHRQMNNLEQSNKTLVEANIELGKRLLDLFSQLKNPQAGPLFYGALNTEQVANYVSQIANGTTITLRAVLSLTPKVVSGGWGSDYAVAYFEGDHVSCSTFMQALPSWSNDQNVKELIAARRKAMNNFNESKNTLVASLTTLKYRTKLKGTCAFVKEGLGRARRFDRIAGGIGRRVLLAILFIIASGWFGEWSFIVSSTRALLDWLVVGYPRSFPRINGQLPPLNISSPSFWYGLTWGVEYHVGDLPFVGVELGLLAALIWVFYEIFKFEFESQHH
jgi:hypothetical protein